MNLNSNCFLDAAIISRVDGVALVASRAFVVVVDRAVGTDGGAAVGAGAGFFEADFALVVVVPVELLGEVDVVADDLVVD